MFQCQDVVFPGYDVTARNIQMIDVNCWIMRAVGRKVGQVLRPEALDRIHAFFGGSVRRHFHTPLMRGCRAAPQGFSGSLVVVRCYEPQPDSDMYIL